MAFAAGRCILGSEANVMLVTLSVEARGAASFFQVIVVDAGDVPTACGKAIASYVDRGYDDIRFDE